MRPDPEKSAPSLKSPFDPKDTPEEDLWFLPGDPEDPAPTDMPLPLATRARRISSSDWLEAEARAGRLLAQASAAFARYDERLSRMERCGERLAMMCASSAMEMQGDWLPMERIALYAALREGVREEGLLLSQADWAIRRLISGIDPRDDLYGYLGRHSTEADGLAEVNLFGEPARGDEFADLSRDWLVLLEELTDASVPPLICAGAAFHHWRMSEISVPGAVVEAAVLASVLGAGGAHVASFMPVLLGTRLNLLARGTAKDRLEGWLIAIHDGCNRALLELDRIARWQERAGDATADLSGKTPPLILEQLTREVLVSAEMLSKTTGASKAGIRRKMRQLEQRSLVREVTGHERYRFWGIKA